MLHEEISQLVIDWDGLAAAGQEYLNLDPVRKERQAEFMRYVARGQDLG